MWKRNSRRIWCVWSFLQSVPPWAVGQILISLKTPGCHNGPKFLETCFEVLETSFQAKICTNFPKICTNSPKIYTNFPKRFQRNVVTRFLNNFRIYGSPPSPGVYNDTKANKLNCARSSSVTVVSCAIQKTAVDKKCAAILSAKEQ